MLLVAQWAARLRTEDRPAAYHALVQTLQGEGDRCLQVGEGGRGSSAGESARLVKRRYPPAWGGLRGATTCWTCL